MTIPFSIYLLKSAAWLTGFSMFYILFLRNERFFRIIRIYLIGGILASLMFPLISFHYDVEVVTSPLAGINVVPVSENLLAGIHPPQESSHIDLKAILLIIYLSGMITLAFRMILHLVTISKAIRRNVAYRQGSAWIIKDREIKPSFSFFNYIFINPSTTVPEEEHILNHEKVHVSQKHWFDILLAEMARMLQWVNPFAWLYVGFIRQNNEYLADESALKQIEDPAIYKAVLLNQIFSTPLIPFSNTFSYSTGKKRFDMMKKITASPFRKLKLLFILPVIAVIFYAFATPEYKYIAEPDNSAIIETLASLTKSVKGLVLNEENKPMAGVTITPSDKSALIVTDQSGKFLISNLPEGASLVFSYTGYKTQTIIPDYSNEMVINMARDPEAVTTLFKLVPPPETAPGQQPQSRPMVLIDGIESEKDLSVMDPNTINTISILKDKSATAVFGEKGKNGVIIITTKKSGQSNDKKEVRGIIKIENGNPLEGASIVLKGTAIGTVSDSKGAFALANVPGDGIIVASYVGFKMNMIRPLFDREMVISISKDTVSLGKINLPPPPPPPPVPGNAGSNAENGEKPLYIIDGEIKDIDLSTINSNDIESMNVLKGSKYVEKYGEKAKYGVVEIRTKQKSQLPAEEAGKPAPQNKNTMVLVEEMPMFPGGEKALADWIYKNIRIERNVNVNLLKEPVYVIFTVESTGKIRDIHVKSPVHPKMDAEAVRVISIMPDWKPGSQNGKAVDVIYQLPIDFNPENFRNKK
jgi:TonB-dependent SusC/RagA subfamily outer membrane receptor